MLRDKHRMPTHRRLPPVVLRMGWRETEPHEILGMAANRIQPLLIDVPPQFRCKSKPSPERRPTKTRKCLFFIDHNDL